ncbi:hypothetical protein HMPREF3214_01614 [Alloscardovia omnicolens]|nr:hypothetical protein HMPREF3214_01614 [Alloscardovia omnicolens]
MSIETSFANVQLYLIVRALRDGACVFRREKFICDSCRNS